MKKLLLCLPLFCLSAQAATFTPNTQYVSCFTPAQQCAPVVIDAISHAQRSILVQAYSFTSASIMKALKEAHERGVDVRVILDKGQVSKNGKYTSATYLLNAHIPTWVDYKPAIAHNKIMIFDGKSVLTGSFNFTKSAEERNAENFIIISDAQLAKAYTDNWQSRLGQSRKIG
jgi:phosphatidylserine/phosphatidylglycerophosphate/cardiolipin synthase-like enzyme